MQARFILSTAIALISCQACAAALSATVEGNIKKMVDLAFRGESKCTKFERRCGWNDLIGMTCKEPSTTKLILTAADLAKAGGGDPAILLLDQAVCRERQLTLDQKYDDKRFEKELKEAAEVLETMAADGSLIGNVVNWMGRSYNYGDLYKDDKVVRKIEESEKAQAKKMVDFLFDADANLVPQKTACAKVKKNCAAGDANTKKMVRLESLECSQPATPKMVVTHEQFQAVGIVGGTEMISLLCADWNGRDPLCYVCTKDQLKKEIENELHDVRMTLKEANAAGSMKGKLITYVKGWMLEALTPKVDMMRLARNNPNGR